MNGLTENGEYIPPEPGSAVCHEYDEAGIDAMDADGFPQCAACGWPKSFHRPTDKIWALREELGEALR